MTAGCRVTIVRHGETDWNREGRIQGQRDVPLNELGRQQAHAAARRLTHQRFDALWSSDLRRCVETAAPIAAAIGLSPRYDPALRERAYGRYEGRLRQDLRVELDASLSPGAVDVIALDAPDGESRAAFFARACEALMRIARQHAQQSVVIVTHGGVLDAAHRLSAGCDVDAPRTWSLHNGEPVRFDVDGLAWRRVHDAYGSTTNEGRGA